MKLPADGPIRVLALILLTGGLVAGSFLPGLTPSLTDPAQGREEADSPAEAASFDSPGRAVTLKGSTPTPRDALTRVAVKRDAPAPPPLPEVEGEDPLPDALRTLARSGDVPDDAPLEDPALEQALERAARLPQGLQQDLALLALATAQARDLQAEALEDLDADQRRALASGDLDPEQAREIRSQVDMGKSIQAARLMDAAARQARSGLQGWSDILETPGVRTTGLADPADPAPPETRVPELVSAMGTPDGPSGMIGSAAALRDVDGQAPPLPSSLENATLRELLVTAYGILDVPRSDPAVASVAAASALDPALREVTATGLRHYVHALVLQSQALSELTPAEKAALSAAGPRALDGGSADTLGLADKALLSSAVRKIDRAKALQAADAMAQASSATGKQAAAVPVDPPAKADCPRDTRNATTEGVSPARTDEPVSCTVGDLTVTLGVTDETDFRIAVDSTGDGEPDTVDTTIAQPLAVRLHYDPQTLQVTVYEDADGDGEIDEDEVEFRNEPLRDQDNNVAFVDPYGLFVVGSEAGPTVYDDRYGDVDVPPDPRDPRVDATQDIVDSNVPGSLAGLPVPVKDGGLGIFACGEVGFQGGLSISNLQLLITPQESGDSCVDSRKVDDTAWDLAHRPPNVTVNPNGSHALTLDLGGDSLYTQNVGSIIPENHLQEDWEREENVTVAGYDTGFDGIRVLLGFPYVPAGAVDLDGNDTYAPDIDRRFLDNNLTLGVGLVGAPGVVVDHEGDDLYRAENASIALGAAGGVGLVADLAGDDRYEGRNGSLAGALSESDGLLLDAGGSDAYVGESLTQGWALASNDQALFVDDGDGDDHYEARVEEGTAPVQAIAGREVPLIAQGASFGGGTGVMVDGGGNDTYETPSPPEGEPRHVQGVSFGPTCPPGSFFFCGAGGDFVTQAGFPGILADLGGDDEGLRTNGTVEHSRLGTIDVGPHHTREGYLQSEQDIEGQRRPPTGYVIDAEVRDVRRDGTGLQEGGYVFAPGDVTWNTSEDPLARSAFQLTVPGLMAVGGDGATNWTESYVVGVDLGGDDTYRNRPGAAAVVPDGTPSPNSPLGSLGRGTAIGGEQYRPRLASLHVDLGGSDEYVAEAVPTESSSRAFGSGVGAVGLAYDLAAGEGGKDDTYRAETRALGHGDLGVGVFHDEAGHDTYELEGEDARGLGFASLGGVGVFTDAGGNDAYHAGNMSLGAYDYQLETPAGGDTADAADTEVGSGAFYDGAGADDYTDVSEQALGRVVAEETGTISSGGGTGTDARPVAALFVDDGFDVDAYPENHTEEGRTNNAFWNTSALGRGFDNLDYYLHFQLVWAGEETARRAVSLLLSPSVRIHEPGYPADGANASRDGIATLTGPATVALNATYGGNRSLVYNTRSLAVAPLSEVPDSPVNLTVGNDTLEQVEKEVEDAIDDVPDPGDLGDVNATLLAAFGHYGVDYAEANYWNLQYMLQKERDRDRDGPSHAWLDETQRGADMALGPADQEARYPEQTPRVGGEGVVNGSDGASLRETFVWGIPYGFADFGVTALTDEAVRLTLEDTQFSGLQEKSPNDRMREDVFPAGHVLVNQTFPSSEDESSASATAPGVPAPMRQATAQHLLAVKALAAGLPGGQAVDQPVDDALVAIDAAEVAPAVGNRSPAQPPEAASASPLSCPSGLEGYEPRAQLACVVRDAFHGVVDEADAARNGTDQEAPTALPEVINPPGGGTFVRTVELSADGKEIARVFAADESRTRYEVNWNTSTLEEDGSYRWQDGLHDLTARVYYDHAEDRPNRGSWAAGGSPGADTDNRTRDPYGFYPGTDAIQVRTDNPPRVTDATATDYNPDPIAQGEAGRCGAGLTCNLTYEANLSQDVQEARLEIGPADGGPVHETTLPVEGQDPHQVSYTWDASTVGSEAPPDQDGLYEATLHLTDGSGSYTFTRSNATPFYVTRDDPVTLAQPLTNDLGNSGLEHVDVERLPNGEPDESVMRPWTLPVDVVLEGDERSPVDAFDLYWRVYKPQQGGDHDASTDCPGDLVERNGDKWCKAAVDAQGNSTDLNLTQYDDGDKDPLASRTLHLVARATDAAGNVEERPFPDAGPTMTAGEAPEGSTFVDLIPPESSIAAVAEPTNETTVTLPIETRNGPVRDVDVYWDVAPNASAAGDNRSLLPDSQVDLGDRTFTWTAGHPDVDADPDHGDLLWLLVQATDTASNEERGSIPSLAPIQFDFQGPTLLGNVTVDRRAESLALSWATSEPVPNISARIWPAGSPNETTTLDVLGTEKEHEAIADGLDQNTPYKLGVSMRDIAGNHRDVVVDQAFRTETVVDLQPMAPADGDVVTGTATVAWVPRNVSGDPFVHYNLTLAPDGGACDVPVEEVVFFEGTPARREVTFDTEEIPDVQGAQICLQANNTRNPDDPVVQRIPPEGGFAIDNQAPTTNLTVQTRSGPAQGDWVRGRAEVVLEARDDTEGPVTTWYALDGARPQEYDGPIVLEEDGVYPVEYWSEDALGHVEEARTAEVRVDATPPEGNLTIDGGATRTASTNVTLAVNGTDAVAGVSDIVVQSPGGRHRALPGALLDGAAVEVPWTVAPGDGRKEVQVVLVDEAGNQLTLRRTITLDTTPPTFRRLESRSVGFTQAAVEWTTEEPAVGEVLYKERGSPAFEGRVDLNETAVQQTAVLRDLTPDTTYEVQVVAEDPLGNAAARAITFTTKPDDTPPAPVEDLTAEVLDTGYVELNWSAAFDKVGVSHYVVSRSDAGTFVDVAETPRTVFLDDEAPPGQTVTYRVQAVDVGGNAGSTSQPVQATTDTAPEVLEANVTPERGTPDDTYTYEIVVRDRDGDSPEFVRAVIDGEPRAMTPSAGGSIADGVVYTLETALDATTLSQGTHTYAFHVSDGTQDVRWPEDGAETGPVVVEGGDGDAETAGFGLIQRAVPSAGPLLVLSALAAAGLARRWSP